MVYIIVTQIYTDYKVKPRWFDQELYTNNKKMKLLNPTLGSPKQPIIIDITKLTNPENPEWSKGKFLSGNLKNYMIELPLVTTMTWQHPLQKTSTVSGNKILEDLVSAYDINRIYNTKKKRVCCPVFKKDMINAHFGLKALIWLKDNWLILPPSQKDSLHGKTIYGLASIMFDEAKGLSIPYITFTTDEPVQGWYSLSHNLGRNDRFLVNPRLLKNHPVAEFI